MGDSAVLGNQLQASSLARRDNSETDFFEVLQKGILGQNGNTSPFIIEARPEGGNPPDVKERFGVTNFLAGRIGMSFSQEHQIIIFGKIVNPFKFAAFFLLKAVDIPGANIHGPKGAGRTDAGIDFADRTRGATLRRRDTVYGFFPSRSKIHAN